MHPHCWTFGITLLAAWLAVSRVEAGDSSSTPSANEADGSAILTGFIEQIIRDQLKTEYVDDDDWGKTRRVTVGHKITGKPFEWKLKPRVKEVNDGLWEKYAVRLVNPDEHLNARLDQLEMQEGKLRFGLTLSAKLAGDARLERWRQGIKMLNAHVEAEGTVEVWLSGELGIKFVSGDSLPAVAIEPALTDLNIKLKKFDLKRISKLEGSAAHELGDSLKETIQKELNRREPKIVAKLNKSIAKRKESLQLSASQFAKTGWDKLQKSLD